MSGVYLIDTVWSGFAVRHERTEQLSWRCAEWKQEQICGDRRVEVVARLVRKTAILHWSECFILWCCDVTNVTYCCTSCSMHGSGRQALIMLSNQSRRVLADCPYFSLHCSLFVKITR
jgi:hypothetical protein